MIRREVGFQDLKHKNKKIKLKEEGVVLKTKICLSYIPIVIYLK